MGLWKRGLLASVLALSVCATAAAQPKELAALKGQPVQPVIDKLGAPQSEEKTGAGTNYVWAFQARILTPTRTTMTDYSTGRANTVEATIMMPQLQTCTLRLLVDGIGTIGEVDPKGPFPACSALVDKLQGK